MQRRDLLSVFLGQGIHDILKGCIIHIHIRYIKHSRQFILFTQIPCSLGSDFHAGLTGNHDDRRIGSRRSFFCLTHEIKHTRSIQYIDLRTFPLHRDHGCRNRDQSLLLFFSVIGNRILIFCLAHA